MSRNSVAASILAGLTFASPAAAQAPPVLPPAIDFERIVEQILAPGQRLYRVGEATNPIFMMLDLDRDGSVSVQDRERSNRTFAAIIRAGTVTAYLRADFDDDGVVTREELERYYRMMASMAAGTGGPEANANRLQTGARSVDAMMRADVNGDGRIDWAEMVAAGQRTPVQAAASLDAVYQAVLAFDANKDGKTTMDEFVAGLEKRFAEYDTDSDGVISRAEFEAHWKRLGREAPRVAEISESFEDKIVAECNIPRAPKDAKVVLINAYGIEGMSSVALGPQDEITKASRVIIEAGEEPLYIVLTAWARTVWLFEGRIDRVKRVVLAAVAPHQGPSAPVGVTGLPKEIVTFGGTGRCDNLWVNMNTRNPDQTKQSMRALTGRSDFTVIDKQNVWNLRLPSGEVSEPTEFETRDTLPIPSPLAEHVSDVRGKFLGYTPGGIVRVDPSRVISPLEVASYDQFPQQAGLVQLLLNGTLTRNRQGEFLIHKAMYFPPGLAGAHSETFRLLKDVPMPSGDPGHSTVVSEETGKRLCNAGKCTKRAN